MGYQVAFPVETLGVLLTAGGEKPGGKTQNIYINNNNNILSRQIAMTNQSIVKGPQCKVAQYGAVMGKRDSGW